MKVTSLKMKDVRGIQGMCLEFSDQLNVIAGVNGSGKSAVLDCLAISLSWMLNRIRTQGAMGSHFGEEDIRNGSAYAQAILAVQVKDTCADWTLVKARKARAKTAESDFTRLNTLTESIRNKVLQDSVLSLPLAVYYDVNRAVLDIPLRIRKRHAFTEPVSAYEDALTKAPSRFRTFFEWFREREDIENETMRTSISSEEAGAFYQGGESPKEDRQLTAVRKAISNFLPGFSQLRVRRSPLLRMTLTKNGEELRVDQLSDGEKCLLAMVGDLARRLAIANPSLEDPLQGSAVVIIDEIDLHLHPAWQRSVVPTLLQTFPQCQFIISTHSPQILSHVNHEYLYILESNGGQITATRPAESYGKSSDRILEDLMGVSSRPPIIKERIDRLYEIIVQGNLPAARKTIAELHHEIGEDPDLVKANVLIQRREAIGR